MTPSPEPRSGNFDAACHKSCDPPCFGAVSSPMTSKATRTARTTML